MEKETARFLNPVFNVMIALANRECLGGSTGLGVLISDLNAFRLRYIFHMSYVILLKNIYLSCYNDMLVLTHFFILYILYTCRAVLPKHAVIVKLSAFL